MTAPHYYQSPQWERRVNVYLFFLLLPSPLLFSFFLSLCSTPCFLSSLLLLLLLFLMHLFDMPCVEDEVLLLPTSSGMSRIQS